MSRFRFGPEHVGKRVRHTESNKIGTINYIDSDSHNEYKAMGVKWDSLDALYYYSLEGKSAAHLGIFVSLDEQDFQPAPAPTISEIAEEITARMDAADKITFRSETEEKLWLHTFTHYMGNANAPATEYADNAVLQYRARMPNAEPQAVRVQDAPPHMMAYSRLMEMGDVEAAKRIAHMPLSVKKRGWHIKYKYLHLWLHNAFDWDEEEQIAGSKIWLCLHDKALEQRVKLYTDEQ